MAQYSYTLSYVLVPDSNENIPPRVVVFPNFSKLITLIIRIYNLNLSAINF